MRPSWVRKGRAGRLLPGQEHAGIGLAALAQAAGGSRRLQGSCGAQVGFAAEGAQLGGDAAPFRSRQAFAGDARLDRRDGLLLPEPQGLPQARGSAGRRARLAQDGAQRVALAGELDHQLVEALRPRLLDHPRHGPAERAVGREIGLDQHGLARIAQQFGRAAVVEHRELRRDVGLEGKEVQHPLAEGMDGEELEAAGRLHRRREQPPRPGQRRRVRQGSSIAAISRASSASGRRAQRPRSRKMRFCMLAAAALVKVRHRMRAGAAPASSSRTTRRVSTVVLPEPALADLPRPRRRDRRPGAGARW